MSDEQYVAEYTDAEIGKPDPEPDPEPTPDPEPEPSPEPTYQELQEEKARASGWAPKEEWKGDPDEWVSAEIFNVRGPLFDKIKQQNNQLSSLDKKIEVMNSLIKKTREDERKKVLAELNREKLKKMEEGDYAGVMETDAKIDEVKEEKPEETPTLTPQHKEAQAKVIGFFDDNPWYNKEIKMRLFADTAGQVYMNDPKNINASVDDVLEYVVEETKKEFPAYFGKKPVTQNRSPVGGDTPSPLGKKKDKQITRKDLDDAHRDVLDNFVDMDDSGDPREKVEARIIKEWIDIKEIEV